MKLLSTKKKNKVLLSMIKIIEKESQTIIEANQADLAACDPEDRAIYDRLVIDEKKIEGMVAAIRDVREQEDPVSQIISEQHLENGLRVLNKTAPFGTIMIIYESRPDVTIEAAVLAFKANNQILLKGGKEAKHSNKVLVNCWHQALEKNKLSKEYIQLLEMDREQTQAFLKSPNQKLDLIVPRGGEKLIAFVKEHAKCAVLVSGRGNNFLYVHQDADWSMTLKIIINAKTQKISACNALDKVLLNKELPHLDEKVKELRSLMMKHHVEVLLDGSLGDAVPNGNTFVNEAVWDEEFLAMKMMLATVASMDDAIAKINAHSGGHSTSIMTKSKRTAQSFMEQIDSAAVYHNASTRFTDGGQMGVGAELAISTDKLHHRGPLGLKQLVTNKYYVYGNGQIRE